VYATLNNNGESLKVRLLISEKRCKKENTKELRQSTTRSHLNKACLWCSFLSTLWVTKSVTVSRPRLWLRTKMLQIVKMVVMQHRFVARRLAEVTIWLEESLHKTQH